MKDLLRDIVILLSGLFTYLLVLVCEYFLVDKLKFDLFTYNIYHLPIGAGGMGLLAMLGFFVASIATGYRPTKASITGGYIVAALLPVAINLVTYAVYLKGMAPGAHTASFHGYLFGDKLFYTQMTVNRGTDTLGRLLTKQVVLPMPARGQPRMAAYFYLSEMAIVVFGWYRLCVMLRKRPYCETCGVYYKNFGTGFSHAIRQPFANEKDYDAFRKKLDAQPLFSEAYFDILTDINVVPPGKDVFTWYVTMLQYCPKCDSEIVLRMHGGVTNPLDAERLPVPEGMSLKPIFAKDYSTPGGHKQKSAA